MNKLMDKKNYIEGDTLNSLIYNTIMTSVIADKKEDLEALTIL